MRHLLKIFYKPSRIYLMVDFLLLVFSLYVVLEWFPLTTDNPFNKYSLPSVCFIVSWVACSYLFQRYRSIKEQKYFRSSFRLFYSSVFILLVYRLLIFLFFRGLSEHVLLSVILGVFSLNYIYLSIYFAYRYAVEYEDDISSQVTKRENAQLTIAYDISEESYEELCKSIEQQSGKPVLKFLEETVALKSGNTFIYSTLDVEVLKFHPTYQYQSIVLLHRLNDIQGIYKFFSLVNHKLPDDGILVCCFESKSTYKKRLLANHIWGINYLLYSLDFLAKRVLPKIFLTKRIYYKLTNGKNRILSKSEIIGRLICAGYKVLEEKKINGFTYFVARRYKQPDPKTNRHYGPMISLRRSGKGGGTFVVYKLRTMHAYSEFVQEYIYEHHNLKDGGKFNKDIRVTTIGRFLRKYWLDELPMLYNLLKGEMKLVGVRPLSAHYLSLYSPELREKRAKYKPGLLPPFYADMPRTIEEIEQSEMRYLNACENDGLFKTDVNYFFQILKNILFKKARSA